MVESKESLVARNVFFSFHWNNDVGRAMNVRHSSRFVSDENLVGWYDSGVWEAAKTTDRRAIQGRSAIQRLIDQGLNNTSVVVVLIGSQTAERYWVDYEIRKGWDDGKGVVGVRIHRIRDLDKLTSRPGPSPFDSIRLQDGRNLGQLVRVYDWVQHEGRANLGSWVEEAAVARGR
ncbi:MAG TPA: TIR domain-containing protein [Solirubrobacterales bacterium]|nr:TIR domain-containing protein [Solirubrobacterales bacterium]